MQPKNNPILSALTQKKNQEVIFGDEAREKLLAGAEILYNAVKSTMGPSGHCVIIANDENCAPMLTKDGITVARSIVLRDKVQCIGAELVKEVSAKTNELAGDGSSTSTILAYALMRGTTKMIASGRSSIGLKRGIDKALVVVQEELKKNTIEVRNREDIVSVGTISANGDREIGEMLADAIEKVGPDGIINIEPAKSLRTTLEVTEGMQLDAGYVSSYFVTNNEKLTSELVDPHVFVTSRKLSTVDDIKPLLEIVVETGKPLLVIADEIEQEALHVMIVNKMNGNLISCAIKAPSYGENRTDTLNDIAALTGATVFDNSTTVHVKNVLLEHLGSAKKIITTKNTSTIIGLGTDERQEAVSERVVEMRNALSLDGNMDDLKRNNMKKRLAKLSGGVAMIKVGGSTEVEIFEKKDRVEDALNATLAASQEGILPGGGVALFYASLAAKKRLQSDKKTLLDSDEQAGVEVVLDACKDPLRVIVENTGKSSEVVITELTKRYSRSHNKKIGYDAYSHQYVDMIEAGIIDPLKVERYALEHACSVVGLVATASCIIVNEDLMKQAELSTNKR